MKKYIRCHIVEAEPMTRGEHLKSKGLALIPGSGSESDEGYFIQYPDGYKSWCPKAQFEKASSPEALYEVLKEFHDEHYAANPEGLTLELVKAFYGQFVHNPCMTFGQAIDACRYKGKKIQRVNWNGQGQYVEYRECAVLFPDNGSGDIMIESTSHTFVFHYTNRKTGETGNQVGWLASQADMAANDWVIVE